MNALIFIRCLVCGLIVAGASAAACGATERSGEIHALALIQKAQTYIKTNGLENSYAEFNRLDSPFNIKSDINPYGDLYLYTLDFNGYQSVHGKNPKIRGKVMIEMRDSEGVPLIKEMVEKCKGREGKGWVSYKWPHPISKEVEPKRGYVERIPNTTVCVGTGIYK